MGLLLFYTCLQRIPNGKWQCPTCSVKSDSHGSKNNLDSISKRSRTKLTPRKSDVGNESVELDKMSSILGSSNLRKKRSSGKGKSSSSQPIQCIREKLVSVDVISSNKPRHSFSNGPAEGSSSILKADNDNQPELSSTAELKQTKSVSLVDSEKNEGNSEKKSGLSKNVGSTAKKVAPLLDAATRKDRKRKYKFYVGGNEKKPKNGENSRVISILEKQEAEENSASCQTKKLHPTHELKEKSSSSQASKPHNKLKSKENSVGPRTSRPQRKRKDVHVAAASLLKNDNETKIDTPLKDEVYIFLCLSASISSISHDVLVYLPVL